MAVETQDTDVGIGDHVVQFYEHQSELVAAVGPYLSVAITTGEVGIVIATETHRQAFDAALRAAGVDPDEARAQELLFSLDAAATMAAFMIDGEINRDAFHEIVGGLVRRASASGRPVRAYGEMVALLWDAGDVLAAIELETMWNDMAHELPFSLFCAYPATSVAGPEHTEMLHRICCLHSSVLSSPANGDQEAAGRSPANGSGEAAGRSLGNEVTADFPAERDAPRQARQICVAALREWGHDERLLDDAALVLSEMATNAVVHARSPFSVALSVVGSKVRIAVQDSSPLVTAGHGHALVPQPGHGLGLIELIATRWGAADLLGGKVVWAELHAEPHRSHAGQTIR